MFKKFLSYYKPHLVLFIADMFCALIVSAIDLIFPYITNTALKQYLGNTHVILKLGLVLLILFIIKFLCGFFIGYYGHMMGIRLESDIRMDLYKKFQSMDYQYFDDKKTGDLMTNLTSHLFDVSEMSHHAPEDIVISFLMLIGSFTILLTINLYLTLIVFAFLLCMIIFSIFTRRLLTKGFKRQRKEQGELASKIESSISGIRLTKAFDNGDAEILRFMHYNDLYKAARYETFKGLGLFSTGNDFFINLTNLALLVFGCLFIDKGYIQTIDLITYFLYINYLIKPVSRLVNSIEQIEQGFSGFEKVYEVFKVEPKIVSKEDAIKKDDFLGDIEFKNVNFQYEESEDTKVLKDFSLKIEHGKKVALVGETGVGKSTISKLVPRFYDCNSGEILVDDINVKDYDLSNLRKAIGEVQQDVFIFYGSIKENILYGRLDATDDEVIEAAKKARIHDFIVKQEKGYDTLVGERGIKLSGGQKQRIAIARLFLKNPKILILDEATSSLDNITENLIQESLDELSKGRTTITIAHRLSTVKNADEIIVLGTDGIIERGTHKELIEHGNYYAKLYETTLVI